MLIKLVPSELISVNDLLYNRFEEMDKEMRRRVPEFEKAQKQLTAGYDLIKEKSPELYHDAIIEKVDGAVGDIESLIRIYFYRQGIKDALELKEFLNETL